MQNKNQETLWGMQFSQLLSEVKKFKEHIEKAEKTTNFEEEYLSTLEYFYLFLDHIKNKSDLKDLKAYPKKFVLGKFLEKGTRDFLRIKQAGLQSIWYQSDQKDKVNWENTRKLIRVLASDALPTEILNSVFQGNMPPILTYESTRFEIRKLPYCSTIVIGYPFTSLVDLDGEEVLVNQSLMGVAHEIGHQVYETGLAKGEKIERVLRRKVKELKLEEWVDIRLEELFSDAYGVYINGPNSIIGFKYMMEKNRPNISKEHDRRYVAAPLRPFIKSEFLRKFLEKYFSQFQADDELKKAHTTFVKISSMVDENWIHWINENWVNWINKQQEYNQYIDKKNIVLDSVYMIGGNKQSGGSILTSLDPILNEIVDIIFDDLGDDAIIEKWLGLKDIIRFDKHKKIIKPDLEQSLFDGFLSYANDLFHNYAKNYKPVVKKIDGDFNFENLFPTFSDQDVEDHILEGWTDEGTGNHIG